MKNENIPFYVYDSIENSVQITKVLPIELDKIGLRVFWSEKQKSKQWIKSA